MDNELRDVIIETRNDVRHIKNWSEKHDTEDDIRFKVANERIAWIEKVAWSGIGGLAVLNILLKVIHI